MISHEILSQLKEKLLSEKQQLESQLSRIAEKKGSEDLQARYEDVDRDEETNADEVEKFTSDLAVTETLENNLKEVNQALERMEKGTYGLCENCPGEEVPVDRLMAYPAAKTCIKCQNK